MSDQTGHKLIYQRHTEWNGRLLQYQKKISNSFLVVIYTFRVPESVEARMNGESDRHCGCFYTIVTTVFGSAVAHDAAAAASAERSEDL